MKYNTDYINIMYSLMNVFMINASDNIFDISYNVNGAEINIQVVLKTGTVLRSELEKVAYNLLPTYKIGITVLYLTKEQFNENHGEWNPKYYQWLDNLLFSKAEVL